MNLDAYLHERFARVELGPEDLDEDQRTIVRFFRDNPFSAAFVGLGKGKTGATLTLLSELADDFAFRKALIVAPLRVANTTWPAEIQKWRHAAPLTWSLLTGDRAARERAAASPALLHIINQENVAWLVEHHGKRWPYDVVVFDESSRLRDHRSKVFKALNRVRPALRRFHQLTATPAAQSHMHLFAQVYLLDRGERFGRSIVAFRERFFDHNPWRHTYTPKPGAAEAISKAIADICLVIQSDRDRPLIRPRKVRLTEAEMRAYETFERDFVLETPEEALIEAPTAAALSGKLLQLASGAVYDAERRVHLIHDHKVAELRQIREEALGEPLLVAYWFKSSLERLRRAFPDAVVMDKRGDAVAPWNRREIPMLLVHPMSAAHGLNMQHGGRHIVVFDGFWSLELFQQLLGRLNRRGQAGEVVVQPIVAAGTVDETVVTRLAKLEDAQDALLQRIRAIRRTASGPSVKFVPKIER